MTASIAWSRPSQGLDDPVTGDDKRARRAWREALDLYERLHSPEAAALRTRVTG